MLDLNLIASLLLVFRCCYTICGEQMLYLFLFGNNRFPLPHLRHLQMSHASCLYLQPGYFHVVTVVNDVHAVMVFTNKSVTVQGL